MALIINPPVKNDDRLPGYPIKEWHIGDPIPEDMGRVVSFRADGHELQMIYAAMASAYIGPTGRVDVG